MQYEVLPFFEGLADAAAETVRGLLKTDFDPAKLAQVKNKLLSQFTVPAIRAQLRGVLIKDGLTPTEWLRDAFSYFKDTSGEEFVIHTMIRLSAKDLEDRTAWMEKLTVEFPYVLVVFLFQIAITPPACANPIVTDVQALLTLKAAASDGLSEDEATSFRASFVGSPIDISSVLTGLKRKANGEEYRRPGQYM